MNSNHPGDIRQTELVKGYEYPVSIITLDEQDIVDYLKATDDCDSFIEGSGMVPPLAAAALALAELSKGTIPPPGTVHLSQELDFKKAIAVGEHLKLVARVEKRLERGDWNLLTTVFSLVDGSQDTVMTGKIIVTCRTAGAIWRSVNQE